MPKLANIQQLKLGLQLQGLKIHSLCEVFTKRFRINFVVIGNLFDCRVSVAECSKINILQIILNVIRPWCPSLHLAYSISDILNHRLPECLKVKTIFQFDWFNLGAQSLQINVYRRKQRLNSIGILVCCVAL